MKGKIAFVLGATVGYVLGTRAGRERYEQIKQGAQSVWNTEPVQRGVGLVREAAQGRVDRLKATVVRAGKGAFVAMTRDPDAPAAQPRAAVEKTEPDETGEDAAEAAEQADAKPASKPASKSASKGASKSAAKPAARSTGKSAAKSAAKSAGKSAAKRSGGQA